jgi:DNA-binding NarL/FixJ family response regulator
MARIVVADDHALVRAGLRRILEATGHIVVGEVGDGLEVVEVVRTTRPDVLVLDLGLPGLHGLDVIRDVLRRVPEVRILVVSAFSRDDFVVSAFKNGAAGYLLKASGSEELLQAVGQVAEGGYFVSSELSAILAKSVSSEARAKGDPYNQLTPRERQVFHLMAEGLSNSEIGVRLFIAMRTAETHRLSVMRKLELNSQTDVVIYALRRGLLGLEHPAGPEPTEQT